VRRTVSAVASGTNLAGWTGPEVIAACRAAYNVYRRAKTESYRAYFAANPQLKANDHAYKAKDLEAALPDGWGGLATQLPRSERHRHCLSGNSSQILALGLLGAGAKLDPWLNWLWNALGPIPPAAGQLPDVRFEYTLKPQVLDERPRQTSIDFWASDSAVLLCVEAKWTEAGIGACGCGKAAAAIGNCAEKVRKRSAYSSTAKNAFALPDRRDGKPCPLSFTYQAVRNVAASQALAGPGRDAVFGLIYDAENPYFAGCGSWPGWPVALHATLDEAGSPVRFASVSWQELLPLLPLDQPAAAWASAKHGLHRAHV
jgi:hypothetical protein